MNMEFSFYWFRVKLRKSIDLTAKRSISVNGILAGKLPGILPGRIWQVPVWP
jgi:hypothetical protein